MMKRFILFGVILTLLLPLNYHSNALVFAEGPSLTGLTIQNGPVNITFNPEFSSTIYSYDVMAGPDVGSVTVTPTVIQGSNLIIKVNDVVVASGQSSQPVFLSSACNVITITVTSEDGFTVVTYTVTIRKTIKSAFLSGLVLNVRGASMTPGFTKTTYNYMAPVGSNVSSATVIATAEDPAATIKVNDVIVPSGTLSAPIYLSEGSNIINVLVTAADGSSQKIYTIIAYKGPLPCLTGLVVQNATSSIPISPVFSSSIYSYTAMVGPEVGSVTLIPIANQSNIIKVNNTRVVSGQPSPPISLTSPSTGITITVASADGIVIETYSLTISKTTKSAFLSALALNARGASISPVFRKTTYDYTAVVASNASSATVTATAEDQAATIKVNDVFVSSGIPSMVIYLNEGSNIITVLVIAADGSSQNTYRITLVK